MKPNIEISKENINRDIGLWIDHRKAIIIGPSVDLNGLKTITSDIEEHVRFSGGAQKYMEENQRDRRYTSHLKKYYDEVIEFIEDAESVLIIGPGEAKVEFKKRLEAQTQIIKVVSLETADKMTNPQILAKVREHFAW